MKNIRNTSVTVKEVRKYRDEASRYYRIGLALYLYGGDGI
jgi:hypothetical protein